MTLCLASMRILFVSAVVDIPKYFVVYFYVEKFMISPETAGSTEAGFAVKNVSFVLIWMITLIVVFARFNRNRDFFKTKAW